MVPPICLFVWSSLCNMFQTLYSHFNLSLNLVTLWYTYSTRPILHHQLNVIFQICPVRYVLHVVKCQILWLHLSLSAYHASIFFCTCQCQSAQCLFSIAPVIVTLPKCPFSLKTFLCHFTKRPFTTYFYILLFSLSLYQASIFYGNCRRYTLQCLSIALVIITLPNVHFLLLLLLSFFITCPSFIVIVIVSYDKFQLLYFTYHLL